MEMYGDYIAVAPPQKAEGVAFALPEDPFFTGIVKYAPLKHKELRGKTVLFGKERFDVKIKGEELKIMKVENLCGEVT